MSKKILSVVLALVFVVSTFAVSAFAVGDIALDPEASTKTQTWALGEPSKDAPYTVDVSLTANYKVGAIQFKVANADGNAVLTDVALNAAVFGEDWATNYDIDFTEDGLVLIVPTPANADKKGPDLTAGAVIVTLTYELAEGASSAKIGIANDPKNADNIGGSLIAVRMSDDSLTTGTLYYGQTVTSVGETRTLGSAAAEPADLALTDAGSTAGVIIDTNKFASLGYAGVVYGFTQSVNNTFRKTDYLSAALQVTNGGTWELARTIGTAGYGTGTTITIKNADGSSTGKVYVVVCFGDVTGDGLINTADVTATNAAVSDLTNYPNNSVKRLAANCQDTTNQTLLHKVNTSDVLAVFNHVAGTKLNAAKLASNEAAKNANYQ